MNKIISRSDIIAFNTLTRKEISRFMRIWLQTILPPAITMSLYFIIFGRLIGPRIGTVEGVSYMSYITPGLIMMSIVTNAYSNVSSSFFSMKFQRSIEELLIAPIPNYMIVLGYVCGGVVRGIVVGFVVALVSLFFTHITVFNYFFTFFAALLSAILFSLGGLLNGIFARKFDDVSIIPAFVITPLVYLGGVFYSMQMLPLFWQKVSLLNPLVYVIHVFRYGMLGVSDINNEFAFAMIGVFIVILFALNLYLLKRGTGIRE